MRDPYDVLGVPQDASQVDIKAAFRQLAQKHHPDKNPGDPGAEGRFKEISAAYEVLGNPERRQKYDTPKAQSISTDDVFESFFRNHDPFGMGGLHRTNPITATLSRMQSGLHPDIQLEIALTLEETYRGTERTLQYQRLSACEDCQGTGATCVSGEQCQTCSGRGEIQWRQGNVVFSQICHACQGMDGRQFKVCDTCHGRGGHWIPFQVTVSIPAGIKDGSTLRLGTGGNWMPALEAVGSAMVRVHVVSHPSLSRIGDDLSHTCEVDYKDLVLGVTIDVDVFGTLTSVVLPPDSCSGHVARVKGLGFNSADMTVRFMMARPQLSESERETLRTLRAVSKNADIGS